MCLFASVTVRTAASFDRLAIYAECIKPQSVHCDVFPTGSDLPGDSGKTPELFANACRGIADPLNSALQFFACYAEMLYPVLDLVLTRHSDLAAIRHNSIGEVAWHEFLLPVRLARSFPRRATGVNLVYFPLRVSR